MKFKNDTTGICKFSKNSGRQKGHVGLFFKGRNINSYVARSTPPGQLNAASAQAERLAVYGVGLLWGCPRMNFTTTPPFHEMRQDFAAFKKETHMTPG